MAKDPVLVIFQLTGGNDYLNTIVPRQNPLYRDYRKLVVIPEGEEVPIDDDYGFHPEMAPIKQFWDEGKMALIHGIGYDNSPRSHFRSMDIWHTCEPDKVGTEGWVGRSIKAIDPDKENVLTGVNFGQGLPRAMALPGVPVASVSDIENYGVLTGITDEEQRMRALDRFQRIYSPAIGRGPVMDYLGQTGLDALKGADILKTAPEMYSSPVEYAATPIAQKLRGISMVHQANLGTRFFYTQHASFDTHASQMAGHEQLWKDSAAAISDFFADLRANDAAENVVLIMFSEFGRRVRDNGSGTDHGAGGIAFAIGDPVVGGHYSEYPSMNEEDLQEGDLAPNYDFRGFYSTLLEQFMGLDSTEIVGGTFEQLDFIAK